jgi:hypothetical protein
MQSAIRQLLPPWLLLCLLLAGCSDERRLAGDFYLPQGTTTSVKVDIETKYPDSSLYFHLTEPLEKTTEFSRIVGVELIDSNGTVYRADDIRDLKGQGKLIVAVCSGIPRGTRIGLIRITAYTNLRGEKINWWSGTFE